MLMVTCGLIYIYIYSIYILNPKSNFSARFHIMVFFFQNSQKGGFFITLSWIRPSPSRNLPRNRFSRIASQVIPKTVVSSLASA